MPRSTSDLRVVRLLSLIAALQVPTSSAYPYNYGQWYNGSESTRSGSSQELEATRFVNDDGPDQAPPSTVADTTSGSSTAVITATTVMPTSSLQTDSLKTTERSPTTGASFVSTTTESCKETSSVSNTSLPASSIPSSLTTSASSAIPTTTGASPASPSGIYTSPTSPPSTPCGQPTPDVYISIIGSVPFVITGVACPSSTIPTTGTSTQTGSIVTAPMTVPPITSPPTAMPSSASTMPISTTRVPDSSLTSLTTSAVQTATMPTAMSTNGSAVTSLETSGQPSSMPFPTMSLTTASLSLVDTSTMVPVGPTPTSSSTTLPTTDVFQAMSTDAPPAQISQTSTHPVPRLGIQAQAQKLETNKFYTNFFLGSQTAPVFTYPYSVSWSAGGGESSSWGLAISHTERFQLAAGPPKVGSDAGEWAYFVNPIGIQSLVLSAAELSNGTSLTTDTLEPFSVNVNLLAAGASSPTITFPVLQGMSFITALYQDATPLIQSGIGISSLAFVGAVNNGAVFKYRATLNNGYTWLIYVSPTIPGYAANTFTLANSLAVQGQSGFTGAIQVAKLPGNYTAQDETTYDNAAGTYPIAAAISGSVSDTTGNYTLSWTKGGIQSQPLLTFALPHHLDSLSPETSAGLTGLELVTTTKGVGTAIVGDSWTLTEPVLPTSMGFAPWSPSQGEVKLVSTEAVAVIEFAGLSELAQNITQQTNTGTTYYDGKALAKFAAIVYTLSDLAGNATLALTGLQLLEEAFDSHVANAITWPLLYESAWGGIVDSQTYIDGNSGDDFGNAFYNDHHFHYGYFVYAASVIAYLNPLWLTTGTNAAWVNTLIRDYANPSVVDPYFPFSRNFDWYHGHSWAAGLFESFDGKNQESSSEDSMSLYALKMWGKVTGDASLEARGNLLLAIQARSLQHYYLLADDNAVQPPEFIGNKAAGIVFDNKIDHTTYFGNDPSFIEGIHMLPLMPFSTLTRTKEFVAQEWAAYNWTQGVGNVQGGWRGILLADFAIVDPAASYDFFSNATGDFDPGFLDGGASRTWYLAWAAALGGST